MTSQNLDTKRTFHIFNYWVPLLSYSKKLIVEQMSSQNIFLQWIFVIGGVTNLKYQPTTNKDGFGPKYS